MYMHRRLDLPADDRNATRMVARNLGEVYRMGSRGGNEKPDRRTSMSMYLLVEGRGDQGALGDLEAPVC